jgi:hypothetical protein
VSGIVRSTTFPVRDAAALIVGAGAAIAVCKLPRVNPSSTLFSSRRVQRRGLKQIAKVVAASSSREAGAKLNDRFQGHRRWGGLSG